MSMGCVQVPMRPESLSLRIPEIDATVPIESGELTPTSRMALLFSQPIDRSTVTDQSIVFVHGEVNIRTEYDVSALYSAIDRQRLEQVPLRFSFSKNGKLILIQPTDALSSGETYTLLVTSHVLSKDRLPLHQDIPQLPLKIAYRVIPMPSNPATTSVVPTGSAVDALPPFFNERMIDDLVVHNEMEEPESPLSPAPTTPEALPGVPGDSSPGTPIPPNERPSGVGSSPGGGELLGPPPAVVLNEIYYDAVGSDTDGVVFVELHGEAQTSLSRFKIIFVNGSDGAASDTITLPETARLNAQGFYVVADARTGSPTLTQVIHADLVDSFDPQNGPDAVQLLDNHDRLLDAVGYGEGIVSLAANRLPAFEGTFAPDVVNGHSLERAVTGRDTNDNDADFIDRPQPTPGE